MGSILEEHVKLLAGVVEDTWIQSKKMTDDELQYSIGAPVTQKTSAFTNQTSFSPKPITNEFKPVSTEPKIQPYLSTTPISENKIDPLKQRPIAPTKLITPQSTPVEPSQEIPSGGSSSTIAQLFDDLIENLDKKTGIEIAGDIEYIRNRITEEMGYSSVLSQMSIAVATLKTVPRLLSSYEVEDTKKKINFWRKKGNL
jgi:hypothetical protein